MPEQTHRWTIEELYSLPDDGNKYELIRGQLFVTPAPTVGHETILSRLNRLLDPYVEANDLGLVYRPKAVIRIGTDSEVEPDLMVRQPPDDPNASWVEVPLPILVVEVASDSTRRRDRTDKRSIYAEAGIPEYWMVDGESRTVRVVRLSDEDVVAQESVTWQPTGVAAPLVIELAAVLSQREQQGPNADEPRSRR